MFEEFVKILFSPLSKETELMVNGTDEEKKQNAGKVGNGKKNEVEYFSVELLKKPVQDWLLQSSFILQISPTQMKCLNEGLFDLESIRKNHGEKTVTVTDQFEDFKCHMKLKKLIDSLDQEQQKNPEGGKQKVISLFNHCIEEWKEEATRIFDFLKSSVRQNDGLNYLRQPAKDQEKLFLNILCEGSYIGGHQKTLSSFTLNHGPGVCLWTIVEQENVESLYQQQPDLLASQGKWLRSEEFYNQRKIPYRRFYQKPGELLFLGLGTFVQMECLSTCVMTRQACLPLNTQTFKQMYQKILLNRQFKIPQSVPMKNLMLDIHLHHKDSKLAFFIKEFLKADIEKYKEITGVKKISSSELKFCDRNTFICSECKGEIFLACYTIDAKVYCMNCHKPEPNELRCKYNPKILLETLDSESKLRCSSNYCSAYLSKKQGCKRQPEKVKITESIPEVIKKDEIVIDDEVKASDIKIVQKKSELACKKPNLKDFIIINDDIQEQKSIPVQIRKEVPEVKSHHHVVPKLSKAESKIQKEQGKMDSSINSRYLSEEEINRQLGAIQNQRKEVRIQKKGEKESIEMILQKIIF